MAIGAFFCHGMQRSKYDIPRVIFPSNVAIPRSSQPATSHHYITGVTLKWRRKRARERLKGAVCIIAIVMIIWVVMHLRIYIYIHLHSAGLQDSN